MKILDHLFAKERQWALAALVVALGAAAYAWVFEPLVENVSIGGRQIQSKKSALKKNLKSLARYESLRAEYERVAGHALLPAGKEDVTESLGDLEKIAGECLVSITSVKPQTFEGEDGSNRILFDVEARADALGLTRFLYRLETSPHLLRVKRLTVSPGSQDPLGFLQCTLLVSQLAAR